MYDEIIQLVAASNVVSMVKEDIIMGNLIKKDQDDSYYKGIKRVLFSWKSGYRKGKDLLRYLHENNNKQ